MTGGLDRTIFWGTAVVFSCWILGFPSHMTWTCTLIGPFWAEFRDVINWHLEQEGVWHCFFLRFHSCFFRKVDHILTKNNDRALIHHIHDRLIGPDPTTLLYSILLANQLNPKYHWLIWACEPFSRGDPCVTHVVWLLEGLQFSMLTLCLLLPISRKIWKWHVRSLV